MYNPALRDYSPVLEKGISVNVTSSFHNSLHFVVHNHFQNYIAAGRIRPEVNFAEVCNSLATFQVFSYLGSRGSQWVKGGVRGVPGGKRDVYGVQGERQGCPKRSKGQWSMFSHRINCHI